MKEIKYIIEKQPDDYDHDDVRFIVDGEQKGFGFKARLPDDQTIALIKCPLCNRENYALAVSSGQCSFCEFNTSSCVEQKSDL